MEDWEAIELRSELTRQLDHAAFQRSPSWLVRSATRPLSRTSASKQCPARPPQR